LAAVRVGGRVEVLVGVGVGVSVDVLVGSGVQVDRGVSVNVGVGVGVPVRVGVKVSVGLTVVAMTGMAGSTRWLRMVAINNNTNMIASTTAAGKSGWRTRPFLSIKGNLQHVFQHGQL
jgi:hypothetical protein